MAENKEDNKIRKYLLPQAGNFYKANLHSHSTITDGKLAPQEMKELYKSKGYSVIAYTDHDVMIPHHELTDDTFLALTGFEAEFNQFDSYPLKPNLKTCHLCFVAGKSDMETMRCIFPHHHY